MYVDVFGRPITAEKGALVLNRLKQGKFSISIWWRHIPALALRADEINLLLDGLDQTLTYKETRTGCKTIATVGGLKEAYFVRDEGREFCGCRITPDEDIMVFRYVLTLGETSEDNENAGIAYNIFRKKTKEILGQSLESLVGGLPEELHKYRFGVPSPINWTNPNFTNKEINKCVKADICSAYGTEGSKPIPDLHARARKIVDGRVEPSAEYPFAFYLESGELSIFGEGNSWEYANTRYMGNQKRKVVEKEQTLLCKATTKTLRPVFEYFYDGRKKHEYYKFVMVATIGMFHRQTFKGVSTNLWPIAAVIKFRCNKRIIDYCNQLVDNYQVPLLINTDSITWRGRDTSITTTEKKLGNFALEYANCSMLYSGAKKYQVRDDDNGAVLTRWSGNHRKTITDKLSFGEILNKEIIKKLEEQEKRATYRWSKEKRRFINQLGEIYTYVDYEMEDNEDE